MSDYFELKPIQGPPNAQKNSESSSTSQIESSYELMLKQQQLLLQLELEWQQKMANGIILTSTQVKHNFCDDLNLVN